MIEQRLNRQRPLGRRYETLNFCLPGYSTLEEAALYAYVVRHFRPDVLVVWYFLNDVDQYTPRYIDREARNYVIGRIDPAQRSRWRLWELIQRPIRERIAHREFVDSVDRAYEAGHPGWRSVEVGLERLRRISRVDEVPCYLVIFPWLYRLDGDSYPFEKAHRAVEALAAREDMGVLDLLPVLAGSRDREYWVHPQDQHPNELAHAKVADATYEFLSTRLELSGEDLLSTARARMRLSPVPGLAGAVTRDWYRPFAALSHDDG